MEFKDHDGGADQQTRYETLRQVSGVIASQADLNGVLEDLGRIFPAHEGRDLLLTICA
jgi:hypothetical protein